VRYEEQISVVICTHNGAGELVDLLKCLSLQTAKAQTQVIIVDDNSTDDTAKEAKNWLAQNNTLSAKLVSSRSEPSLPAARNLGLSLVTTELVVFTDDDCRPNPDWVKALLVSWKKQPNTVVGISGPIEPSSSETFNQKYTTATEPLRAISLAAQQNKSLVQRFVRYFNRPVIQTGDHLASVVGANMSFRSQALRAVVGFETQNKFGSDDTTISWKLRQEYGDNALMFDSSIKMAHNFAPKFSDSLRRAYRYALANGNNARAGAPDPILPLPTPVLSTFSGIAIASLLSLGTGGVTAALAIPVCVLTAGFIVNLRLVRYFKYYGPSTLLFPPAKLLEELADNLGFIRGWISR
jgi:glycosyltransferase involved in cell wall biosynthesis